VTGANLWKTDRSLMPIMEKPSRIMMWLRYWQGTSFLV
jgi:hypothetical protein